MTCPQPYLKPVDSYCDEYILLDLDVERFPESRPDFDIAVSLNLSSLMAIISSAECGNWASVSLQLAMRKTSSRDVIPFAAL